MEPPSGWSRLTAATALCDRCEPSDLWRRLVALEYVVPDGGNPERVAALLADARSAAGEPGPSAASYLTGALEREGVATALAASPDPWGLFTAAILARSPYLLSDEIRAGIAFVRREASRGIVPGFLLGERKGVGTDAEVVSGVQVETGAVVTVRLLREGAGGATFARVADTLTRLNHPGIPRLVAAGARYLVVTQLPDTTLADVIRDRGPQPAWEVCRLVHGIAGVLGHAHARGVVFGDLAPRHVRLSPVGAVSLDGFGEFPPPEGRPYGNARRLAPELLTGQPPSPASDVFGLAGIAAALLGDDSPVAAARSPDPTRRPTLGDFTGHLSEALDVRRAEWRRSRYSPYPSFETIRTYPDFPTDAERVEMERAIQDVWSYVGNFDSTDREELLNPLRPAAERLVRHLRVADSTHFDSPGRTVSQVLAALGPAVPGLLRAQLRLTGSGLGGLFLGLAACGGAGEVFEALRSHPEFTEREHAARALAHIAPPGTFDALAAAVACDPDGGVRRRAARALVNWWQHHGADDWEDRSAELRDVLRTVGGAPEVAREAVEGFKHQPEWLTRVLESIFLRPHEQDPVIRRSAAEGLAVVVADGGEVADGVKRLAARLAADPADPELQRAAAALHAVIR